MSVGCGTYLNRKDKVYHNVRDQQTGVEQSIPILGRNPPSETADKADELFAATQGKNALLPF